MNKLLLALPLLVGGSWAGASYLTGSQTQDAYAHVLSQLNASGLFELVNEQYTAGFVNSTAITRVMSSAESDSTVLFRLQHAIQHSPIGLHDGAVRMGSATIKTTLLDDGSTPESMLGFIEGFEGDEPLWIDSNVSFDGAVSHNLRVATYEHQHDGSNVRFGGVDIAISTDSNSMQGTGSTGELVISSESTIMRLSPGKIEQEFTQIDDGTMSGSYALVFDKFTVSGPQHATSMAFKSINVASGVDISDGKIDFDSQYSVASIDSPLPLNNVSVDTRVSGLSIAGLGKYRDVASGLVTTDTAVTDSPEQLSALLEAAYGMLAPSTRLSYELEVGNDAGDASLAASLEVVGENSPSFPASGLASIATLRDVLNVLQFKLQLEADADAIDQSPLAMFLGTPQARQLIVSDGSTYSSDVSIEHLMVDINGKLLPLEMMLSDTLDKPLISFMDSI